MSELLRYETCKMEFREILLSNSLLFSSLLSLSPFSLLTLFFCVHILWKTVAQNQVLPPSLQSMCACMLGAWFYDENVFIHRSERQMKREWMVSYSYWVYLTFPLPVSLRSSIHPSLLSHSWTISQIFSRCWVNKLPPFYTTDAQNSSSTR